MPPPYECPTRSTFSRPSASSHSPPAWARASDPPPNTDRAGHNAPPTSPPTAACDPDPGRSPAATRPPACDAPPPDEAPPPASPSTLLTLDQHERTSVKAPTDGTMCLRLNAQSGERCSCGQRGTMFLRPSTRHDRRPDPKTSGNAAVASPVSDVGGRRGGRSSATPTIARRRVGRPVLRRSGSFHTLSRRYVMPLAAPGAARERRSRTRLVGHNHTAPNRHETLIASQRASGSGPSDP